MAEPIRCSQGHENVPGDNFCRTCGEKVSGGMIRCRHCGSANDSGAKYCVQCGKKMGGENPPQTDGARWRRGDDDFATRVDLDDLDGIFRKGVVVEQGTKALLFVNGALAETLQPGLHDFSTNKFNFGQQKSGSAILVDAGDLELALDLKRIYTGDPLAIDITCKVVVRVDNPTFFFTNVMKGRVSYLVSELRRSLYDEMTNAFNEAVGKKPVTELNHDLSLKKQLEVSVENHLRTTLQRNGLNLIQLRTIDYHFLGFDKIRGINEEVFLLVSEEEAKLQGRKRLFNVFDKTQLQELFEETRKTEHYRQVSAVRIDQAKAEAEADLGMQGVAADKEIDEWKLAADFRRRLKEHLLDKNKTDDDIERFLLEIEKNKFLREQEIKELKRFHAEKDQDHEMKRQFMLRKLELEQELDYERQRLIGKEELEKDLIKKRIEKKQIEYEADIATLKAEAAAKREVDIEDALGKLEVELESAKTSAEKRKIEIEIERLEDDNDLITAEKANQLMLRTKHEKMKIQLEEEERRLEMEIKKVKALHDMEIEKIAALSSASVEALISLSGPEQARMLKDLKETEAMKGMSEEQILAMAAAKSPEVAKAFQEKFKGASKDEIDKMYKMVIDAKDKAIVDQKAMVDTMERIVSKAFERGVGQPANPNIVFPPTGQPGVYAGPTVFNAPGQFAYAPEQQARVIICSKCRSEVRTGVKFCPNCGVEMY